MTAPMKPSEVLRAARELISVPERWTQGSMGRTADGAIYSPLDNTDFERFIKLEAVCFCAMGAVFHCASDELHGESSVKQLAAAIHDDADEELFRDVVADFNDSIRTTHDKVLAAFDRAIALAEQSESVTA